MPASLDIKWSLTPGVYLCLLPRGWFDFVLMPQHAPPNETVSDTDLVRRLKARDPEAMEILVRVHGSKLFGIAYQFTRNENVTEDVVQEALISIWNKIDTFQGRSSFTSWMYRVAANCALMRLRKEKRHVNDISIDQEDIDNAKKPLQLPGNEPLPGHTIQGEELKDHIQRAIDRLPEPYRSVVILKDVEEFSLEEISEMTNASLAAVKSRLHRARLTLRQMLLPYLITQEARKS